MLANGKKKPLIQLIIQKTKWETETFTQNQPIHKNVNQLF